MDLVDRMNSMGIGAPRGGQLSGAATFPATNSTTSLNSLSTATTIGAQPNGQVVATSNIINQRAVGSRSVVVFWFWLFVWVVLVGGVVGLLVLDRKGGEPAEWPPDLRARQFPEVTA
jgi:cell division control protein 24